MSSAHPIALTRHELYQRVWAEPLTVLARRMGVSANGIAKICNRLLIPYPPRGYWSKASAGRAPDRPPLPPAPDSADAPVTISALPASSRRARTRLDPAARLEQLLRIAADIAVREGLHAASMKRIAAAAGVSETQVYNYFGSRDKLLVELARCELGKIRAARQADVKQTTDHYDRVTRTTRTYLREIAQRGPLLQMLLSSPEVRAMLRSEHHEQHGNDLRMHAEGLIDLYGSSRAVAMACTVLLTALCLRVGRLVCEQQLPLATAERLCLAIVLQGSHDVFIRNTVVDGS